MEDPRVEWSIQHKLIDIITIAISSVICGKEFGDKKLSQPSHPDPSTQVKKSQNTVDLIFQAQPPADTWVDIETYGLAKKDWFKQFLELANGIPSHDTFARVFARIEPEQFQPFFLSWIKSISNVTQGEVIAIDGKTLRH